MLIAIFSVFLLALLLISMNTVLAYASTVLPPATTTPAEEQPKPGTLIVITFENGTTRVVRSSSTNVLPVTGGYLVVDQSVVPSQPLPATTVSQSVVNQFNTAIAIVYSIITPPPLPPPLPPLPPSPDECPDGTKLNPVSGECESIECDEGEILQGDDCIPGVQPCGPEWGNPCPETEPEPDPESTPQPVAPQPPIEPEPAPEPGNEDQNEEQDTQNNEESGGNGGGDDSQGGDDSGEEEEE